MNKLMVKKVHSFYYSFNIEKIKSLYLSKSDVYMVRNEKTLVCYIGSALSKTAWDNHLYRRFRNHFSNIIKSSNHRIKKVMEEGGIQNFSFYINALDYQLCHLDLSILRK